MKVWIYAARKMDADMWAREHGIRPRDCYTFGDRSQWRDGMRYAATDRVVVLGEICDRAAAVIERCRLKSARAPEVEYLPLPQMRLPAG